MALAKNKKIQNKNKAQTVLFTCKYLICITLSAFLNRTLNRTIAVYEKVFVYLSHANIT